MRYLTGCLLAIVNISAMASGWNDYRLEIAPGFTIVRANSFDVCLLGADGTVIICPDDPPTFGPLTAYSLTKNEIITRHVGAKRSKLNPTMWDSDGTREFYFRVSRADERVEGPYTRAEWKVKELPELTSLNWTEPQNPNVVTPLFGRALFLTYSLSYFLWPLAVLALGYGGFVIVREIRRRPRRSK
jgi:hypothetical protein